MAEEESIITAEDFKTGIRLHCKGLYATCRGCIASFHLEEGGVRSTQASSPLRSEVARRVEDGNRGEGFVSSRRIDGRWKKRS